MSNTPANPEKESDITQARGEAAMLASLRHGAEKKEISTHQDTAITGERKLFAYSAGGDQYEVHRVEWNKIGHIREALMAELMENRKREDGELDNNEIADIENDIVGLQNLFVKHRNEILSIESQSVKGIENKKESSKAGLYFMAKPDVLNGSITEQLHNLKFRSRKINGGVEFIKGKGDTGLKLTFLEAKGETKKQTLEEAQNESASEQQETKSEEAEIEQEKKEEERTEQIELARENLIKFFDKINATEEFLEKYKAMNEFFSENPDHEYAAKFYETMNDFAKKTEKLIKSTPAKMPSFQAEGGNIRQDIEDYLDKVWEEKLGKNIEELAA